MKKKIRIYSGNPLKQLNQQSKASLYMELSKETRKKIHNLYLENSLNKTKYYSFNNNNKDISLSNNKTNSIINNKNRLFSNISSRPQSNYTHLNKKISLRSDLDEFYLLPKENKNNITYFNNISNNRNRNTQKTLDSFPKNIKYHNIDNKRNNILNTNSFASKTATNFNINKKSSIPKINLKKIFKPIKKKQNKIEEITQDILNTMKKEKERKNILKGRFLTKLRNSIIMSKEQVIYHNFEYNEDLESEMKQRELAYASKYRGQNNINISTKMNPDLIKSEKATNRYEDLFLTPKEFLKKYFTPEEILIIMRDPIFFGLNKEPFKGCHVNTTYSLTDTLNKEMKYKKKEINIDDNDFYLDDFEKIESKLYNANKRNSLIKINNYDNIKNIVIKNQNNDNKNINSNSDSSFIDSSNNSSNIDENNAHNNKNLKKKTRISLLAEPKEKVSLEKLNYLMNLHTKNKQKKIEEKKNSMIKKRNENKIRINYNKKLKNKEKEEYNLTEKICRNIADNYLNQFLKSK